jgi:endonuclease/exonuclease/phosphatase family metal-dependent hydrolase
VTGGLRVLHWNIHSWKDAAGAPNADAVTALIRDTAPDVVSLVEVNEPWGAPDVLAKVADACGYSWTFVPCIEYGKDPSARGYGNALLTRLTRLPVTAVQQVSVYRPGRGYDGSEQSETRSVVLARVGSCWVGGTHFPASEHASRKIAAQALHQLTLRLSTPWLICGDFNAPPDALFGNYSDMRAQPDPAVPSFPAKRPRKAIDYCLASPGVEVTAEVLPVPGSDHLPLLVRAATAAATPATHTRDR